MKTLAILLLSLCAISPVFGTAAAVTQSFGSAPPTSERGLTTNSTSGTTQILDTAFTMASAGKAIGVRFVSPVTQTSAALTVYAYMTAKTGSPTAIVCGIWAGPTGAMNAQRPDTSASPITSATTDCSGQTANTWTTFSITSVSLVAGTTYYAVFYNNTTTQASNNVTFMHRGLAQANISNSARHQVVTTTDGWATVNNSGSPESAFVMKFSDGSIVGAPYVNTTSHASNTNYRGNRYTFSAATVVSGVLNNNPSSASTEIDVYQGASLVASTPTLDRSEQNNNQYIYFTTKVTFAANTAYDVVYKCTSGTTIGIRLDAGTTATPPADVAAAMPSGLSYVDGATPGSFTSSAGAMSFFLMVDDIPAATGGATSYSF